jgi:hypothetical protein
LTPEERQRVFARGSEIVKEFGPQEELNPTVEPILKADRDFVQLAKWKIDWGAMIACEARLLRLADLNVHDDLRGRLWGLRVKESSVPGVKGRIIAEAKTPEGWIIIGSSENNVYDVKEPVALIIDDGGDDVYKGVVASQTDANHGISAILDLYGNDTYEGDDSAFATGRLGCALVVDAMGNDRYKSKEGGIGVGLGGIGIVVDREGNDSYTCSQYGIGLGGPCGSGGVFDVYGSDTYRCGFVVGSGYNEGDAPQAKPGDANYQYDAWGLGIGLGRRLYPFNRKGYRDYTMAGGLGMLVDANGNDHYYASNFAVACGYFFGIGCFVDIKGDDQYDVARYGIASGAHYAMGMFIDETGNDVYRSTGPTYNCGCAWDHSAFFFTDMQGNDTYDLRRSAGPGRADIGSWGMAADLEGNDVYKLGLMPATNSQNGLSGFLDAGGKDVYEVPGGQAKNDVELKVGDGGVFIDEQK